MNMTIYRIIPYSNYKLCLAINPFMENIKLGVYPAFNSDRSLWKIKSNPTMINNYCHQDYGLKVHESEGNVIGVRAGLVSPDDTKCHFYMTKISNNIYTLQVAKDIRKLLSYDKNRGLLLNHSDDGKIDMNNDLWIFTQKP